MKRLGSRIRAVAVQLRTSCADIAYDTGHRTPASPRLPQIGSVLDQPIREDGPHLASLLRQRLQGDGPLYLRLTTALRDAVDRGELAQGTVLPRERTLARELAVSRSTVVAAYDRLKVEGWLDSRQGSGTWVRRPREPDRQGVDAVATRALFLSDEQTAAAPSWGGLGPLFRSGAGSAPPRRRPHPPPRRPRRSSTCRSRPPPPCPPSQRSSRS